MTTYTDIFTRPVVTRIKRILARPGHPTVQAVARSEGMDPTTLRAFLKREGIFVHPDRNCLHGGGRRAMQGTKKLRAMSDAEFTELVTSGVQIGKIAEDLGLKRPAIYEEIERRGMDALQLKRQRVVGDATDAEILEAVATSKGWSAAARKLGCERLQLTSLYNSITKGVYRRVAA